MNSYLQDQYTTKYSQGSTVIDKVVVIDAQNENDELNPNVVTQAGLTDWEDAVLARRTDIATDLGQSPSSVPMALLWVPSNQQIEGGAAQSEETGNAYGYQSGGEEWLQDNGFTNSQGTFGPMPGATYNLHAAEQALEDGSADNIISAGNYGDSSMAAFGLDANNNPIYVNGNQHFLVYGTEDANGNSVPSDFMAGGTQANFITRLADSIVTMLGGTVDMGPIAQSASFVGDNDVLVTFNMGSGTDSFDALSGLASLASGWTLNNSGDPAQIDNFATSASIVDDNQILISFSNSINTSIYYSMRDLEMDILLLLIIGITSLIPMKTWDIVSGMVRGQRSTTTLACPFRSVRSACSLTVRHRLSWPPAPAPR